MKKILILGASILQLPAILKAKELGFYVGTADYDPNAVGIPYADEYFCVSTVDVEGIVNLARSFQPDGIMTLATDMPMRAVAAACQALGLPGITPETAWKATDKGAMIQAFEACGVAHPRFYIAPDRTAFEAGIGQIPYPCILKPTDNAGSRGVVLCHGEAELRNGYDYARSSSRSGAVIMEEYLRGPEFSVEVMVTDGVPHVLQITDKLTTGAPHFVEMGHSQPTSQPEAVREQLRDLAVRACQAVGIHIGPAHVEMILTEEGPKMVELGARMGGDCITTHLVPLSTGIDMVGCTIRQACGEKINLKAKWEKGAAIRFFHTQTGTIKRIDGIDEAKSIPGVQLITVVCQVGETIGKIGSSADRVGFVIAQADTPESAVRVCKKCIEKINISF